MVNCWTSEIDLLQPPASKKEWMTKPYNLAEAFCRICHSLEVQVLSQDFAFPLADEWIALGLPMWDQHPQAQHICFVRQVFLLGDGLPLSYGRVVVPKQTYLKHHQAFATLGGQLLGRTLLYGNPKTTRRAFEFAQLSAKHAAYQAVAEHYPLTIPDHFWSRRSVFYMNGQDPLIVTELLSDALPSFVDSQEISI